MRVEAFALTQDGRELPYAQPSVPLQPAVKCMGGNDSNELVLLDQAGRALAEARSIDEIKVIRDKAEAVRQYAQSAKLGLDIQNRAAEVKLRAERRAGKLLSQLDLRGGDRKSKRHRERLKLDDLGINRNQSTRWQKEAKVPEDVFCEYVRQTCQSSKELTAAGLMRLANTQDEATGGNGATARSHRNGRSAKPSARRSVVAKVPDDRDEVIQELRNHIDTLAGILQPICSGEVDGMRAAERRVVMYLLAEAKALLEHA